MDSERSGFDNWALLRTVANELEAKMLKSLLESFHISAHVVVEPVASLYGLKTGDLAEARVFVPQEQLEDAKRVLEAEPADDRTEDGTD